MSSSDQRTNAEKIEIVLACERNGWDATEGGHRHGVARTTLLGWMTNKHKLFSSQADPSAKRAAPPGMAPPTLQYEAGIVERIKAKVANDQVVCRDDVVADASSTIPGFAERKPAAQSSWTTRFIGRHNLSTFISRRLQNTGTAAPNVNEPPNKRHKRQLSTLAENRSLQSSRL
ncbi:hypothetical protein PR003_g31318 [Phytophthora rubi]|uniref:Uncharacterized protein n=1 Tax=Phytophthora rubi TaxID=129364 RepID=A0A6A4B6X4_9STRA|nr:hypothetical protein PR003_g31318 [Phytophthora rubi]